MEAMGDLIRALVEWSRSHAWCGLVRDSVQFSCSVMSNSLRPHGLQHARPPCPSPTPRVYSNSCPSRWWYHPTILSSVVPFSSCPQSFPASGSFSMSQFFTSGIWVSVWASVLPVNIQDWFPLGWTGWISLQSKGLSRVFSNTRWETRRWIGGPGEGSRARAGGETGVEREFYFKWEEVTVRGFVDKESSIERERWTREWGDLLVWCLCMGERDTLWGRLPGYWRTGNSSTTE